MFMSKYDKAILEVLKKDQIMSTHEVLKALEIKVEKVINWHALYRVLMDLSEKGKIEKLKAKAGFFWKIR